MTTSTSVRWGMFASIGRAVRAATRPGGPSLRARLACLPRLLRATARGEYPGTSLSRLAVLVGAVLYVVSPVDLVPEAVLPLVGLGDDALVVAWIATQLVNQTEDFLGWEKVRRDTVRGSVVG